MVISDTKSSLDSIGASLKAVVPKAWLGDQTGADGIDAAQVKMTKEMHQLLGLRKVRLQFD